MHPGFTYTAHPAATVPGDVVKIYCEANPDYYLTAIDGQVTLAFGDESDPRQQWIMDTSWGINVKDEEGFPAFAVVNKSSLQALRHGSKEKEKVYLGVYHRDDLNEAVLWTQSADVGKGYQCVRSATNVALNLDAKDWEADSAGGTNLVLSKWKKRDTQKWKITPILSVVRSLDRGQPSVFEAQFQSGVYPPQIYAGEKTAIYPPQMYAGEKTAIYPPQMYAGEKIPQGRIVRVYCEANPDFFLAARDSDRAVLGLGNADDFHQQWIKVDGWGVKVKDEAGFPAFALVNKATLKPLKHGRREWDQVHLSHSYNDNELDESILWTLSGDVGNGYRCLRPVSNIQLNLDAKQADGKHGGIKEGNELILFSWKKQSNQKWKMLPVN